MVGQVGRDEMKEWAEERCVWYVGARERGERGPSVGGGTAGDMKDERPATREDQGEQRQRRGLDESKEGIKMERRRWL